MPIVSDVDEPVLDALVVVPVLDTPVVIPVLDTLAVPVGAPVLDSLVVESITSVVADVELLVDVEFVSVSPAVVASVVVELVEGVAVVVGFDPLPQPHGSEH